MKQHNHHVGVNGPALITGGAGFIGSHLSDALIAAGRDVRILDNMSSGKLSNLEPLSSRAEIITGSITNYNDCLRAMAHIETVFHLAACVSVTECQKNPHDALTTNIQGTVNILDAALHAGVQRVLFASTAAVYGNKEGLCSETDIPIPVSTYGYSKYIGEQLCSLYAHVYKLPTISLRFFNVYGPRQQAKGGDGGVLAVFKHKLEHNEPIAIFGDGNQTRDFVHVDQVVQALMQAEKNHHMAPAGQVFTDIFRIAIG